MWSWMSVCDFFLAWSWSFMWYPEIYIFCIYVCAFVDRFGPFHLFFYFCLPRWDLCAWHIATYAIKPKLFGFCWSLALVVGRSLNWDSETCNVGQLRCSVYAESSMKHWFCRSSHRIGEMQCSTQCHTLFGLDSLLSCCQRSHVSRFGFEDYGAWVDEPGCCILMID